VIVGAASSSEEGSGAGSDSDAAFKAKRGRRSRRSLASLKRGSLNSSSGQGSKVAGGRVASIHLPAEQQMELARCVRAWEDAKAAKLEKEARVGRVLTFEEWAELVGLTEGALRRRVDDGRKARELLIMTNINLIKSMALRFTASQERNENRLSMDDLVLEGTQGLLKSMSKFNPSHGVKFTTYAGAWIGMACFVTWIWMGSGSIDAKTKTPPRLTNHGPHNTRHNEVWWIRQAMSMSIQTHSNTVRLPVLLQARIKKVREARARLYLQLAREPSADELAEAVGLPAAKVRPALVCVCVCVCVCLICCCCCCCCCWTCPRAYMDRHEECYRRAHLPTTPSRWTRSGGRAAGAAFCQRTTKR
jgi:DNA-directed RNA polymerase sigma subunit (sigma70/sigma32)